MNEMWMLRCCDRCRCDLGPEWLFGLTVIRQEKGAEVPDYGCAGLDQRSKTCSVISL